MKKTYDIQIGNKILINKIGVFLGILGVILIILFVLIIISSFLMPNEMTMVFFIELVKTNIYLILPISILMVVIGIKVANIRNYQPTELILELDQISFLKKGERIEIPEPRLHKITENKSFLTRIKRIKIKTDTHKEYVIKGTDKIFNHLYVLFPNKTEIKTLGNNVYKK